MAHPGCTSRRISRCPRSVICYCASVHSKIRHRMTGGPGSVDLGATIASGREVRLIARRSLPIESTGTSEDLAHPSSEQAYCTANPPFSVYRGHQYRGPRGCRLVISCEMKIRMTLSGSMISAILRKNAASSLGTPAMSRLSPVSASCSAAVDNAARLPTRHPTGIGTGCNSMPVVTPAADRRNTRWTSP